jgi:hypothetical protein
MLARKTGYTAPGAVRCDESLTVSDDMDRLALADEVRQFGGRAALSEWCVRCPAGE